MARDGSSPTRCVEVADPAVHALAVGMALLDWIGERTAPALSAHGVLLRAPRRQASSTLVPAPAQKAHHEGVKER